MPTIPYHGALIRSLYRTFLRKITKTKLLTPTVDSDISEGPLRTELSKATRNPSLYGRLLWSEIKYYVNEEVRLHSFVSRIGLYMKLLKAEQLVGHMQELIESPHKTDLWHSIIALLVEHRAKQLEKSQWLEKYLRNRDTIDTIRNRQRPGYIIRREASRRRKASVKPRFTSTKPNERYKEYKKQLKRSDRNGILNLVQYIKILQSRGHLPNPYKLPYVSDRFTRQSLYNPASFLPGSGRKALLYDAYDMDYVKAVLGSELEHLINKNHFLDNYDHQFNEKGPWKVKVKTTNAGTMIARYIRLPFFQKEMKDLALDIKKLTRLSKLRKVWIAKSAADVRERKVDQGYAVKGSKGYSDFEVMCTRDYYEKLADAEADWEQLMLYIESPSPSKFWDADSQQLHKSWSEALDITSDYFDDELVKLERKYADKKHLFRKRAVLQDLMTDHFVKRSQDYKKLTEALQKDGVFMHSELVNFNNPVTSGYDQALGQGKNDTGLPLHERLGMGKKLADYLEQYKFKKYRMGYDFARRLKV